MTATGLTLGALALMAEPDLRALRPRPRDVGLGLASAGGLYAVFQVGDRMARRIMPRGGEQIDEIYSLRRLCPTPELAARLAVVIAPAEELFWRGFVQRRLARRMTRWQAAAAAASAYGGAHLVTRNMTLTGAAAVAGGYWSALAAAGLPMPALIVSHIAWDIWIFLIAPTAPPEIPGS
jgi:membrane protease YdiL (CAAX protease family)